MLSGMGLEEIFELLLTTVSDLAEHQRALREDVDRMMRLTGKAFEALTATDASVHRTAQDHNVTLKPPLGQAR